ncbi:hypothetical protein LVJ94_25635 [Pendulispora rubella]|uniref:GH18 domain-containing protein n=1 Tax=Pendulispora rubella TaxID=2741070 RepID=A0ABZ2LI37_9BACT
MVRTVSSFFALAFVGTLAFGCEGPAEDDSGSFSDKQALADCSSVTDWSTGVAYSIGKVVRYNSKSYECIQAHTSQPAWNPEAAASLWRLVDCGPVGGSDGGGGGGGDSGGGGGGGGSSEYAPYFYTWGWGNAAYPFTSLVDMKNKGGPSSATLAFVLSNGGCAATTDVQAHQSDVNAFVSAGGKLKVSFGGANGTYLENACGSASAMANVITGYVNATGIKDLDFDVEQAGAMTSQVNALRSAALATVQQQTGARISFTLAATPRDKWNTPGGVNASSLEVLRSALGAGVHIWRVNLMTMDYGSYYSSGKKMGDLAVSALTDANTQLRSLISGLTEAAAYKMLGATPMIGQNDVAGEIFTQDDARILASFARSKSLGLVSFWAINRDQPCRGTTDIALCSTQQSTNFAFHQLLKP